MSSNTNAAPDGSQHPTESTLEAQNMNDTTRFPQFTPSLPSSVYTGPSLGNFEDDILARLKRRLAKVEFKAMQLKQVTAERILGGLPVDDETGFQDDYMSYNNMSAPVRLGEGQGGQQPASAEPAAFNYHTQSPDINQPYFWASYPWPSSMTNPGPASLGTVGALNRFVQPPTPPPEVTDNSSACDTAIVQSIEATDPNNERGTPDIDDDDSTIQVSRGPINQAAAGKASRRQNLASRS